MRPLALNKILVLAGLAVSCLLAHPRSARAADALTRLKLRIAHLVDADRQLGSAQIGIYLKADDSGRVIYARHADTPLIPASNFKLLTSAVAFVDLGPAFRFTTELLGPPPDASSGAIQGDVYLRGDGDPTLVEPWTRPATGPFYDFADRLWRAGVRRINGCVVGDDSAFDRDFLGHGWRKRYLMLDYAPETGALSINGNVCRVDVRPNHVSVYPPTTVLRYKRFASRGGPSVTRRVGSNEVLIQNVKHGDVATSFTFHNPPLYTTSTFEKIVRARRIRVSGPPRLINPNELPLSPRLVRYGVHHSAPLLKILRWTDKESDNLFAQHIFKAIGWRMYGQGTLATSTRAVVCFLNASGVDPTGLTIADGCGLSVLDRVTPRQLVELLEVMSRRPDGKLWKSILSVAGKDGTLSYRLHGIPCIGKTGTIDGNCSLSGYVRTKAGQQVTFSILVNHHRTSNDHVRWFQDQIVKAVAACRATL